MKNIQNYFPRLNEKVLRSYALKWINRYSGIKRILLCRSLRSDVRYIIVFEHAMEWESESISRYYSDILDYQGREVLFDSSFGEVYREEPPWTFRSEWDITWKKVDGELFDTVDGENIWILYESKVKVVQKRKSARHKEACRKAAKRIWDKDKFITISDMNKRSEIKKACEGFIYTEKTLRNWIKDLCPDRSPGCRPRRKANR